MVMQEIARDEDPRQTHDDDSRPSLGALHPGTPSTRFGLRSLHAIARRILRLQGGPLIRMRSVPGRTPDCPDWEDGRARDVAAWDAGPCFARFPASRPAADAHRVAYAGQLSPSSGVADFLLCAAAWAERNPGRRLELCWIGEGSLRGVLMAQPLPANLVQEFTGALAPADVAERFGRSGLLVLPNLSRSWPPFLAEAMTAGLVVLGSSRNPAVRSMVVPGQTGWLFDPFSAKGMLDVLDTALTATPVQLDAMRAAARVRVGALPPRAPAQRPMPGGQRTPNGQQALDGQHATDVTTAPA